MPGNRLLVQTREPASLAVVNLNNNGIDNEIAFGGESTFDTGHEMFHRDTGAGIACASCHGEGGEDGHVWRFAGIGPRRTQALHVGLEGTAPFHWEGDMQDIGHLMEEVLVGRMGGVHESPERTRALEHWLFSIEPPAVVRAVDDEAALRGHAIFQGAAQCGTCHTGDKLTNNETVDVGTGERLQVPSLVAIAYRAPFVHTGCAETLRERFDPECGGTLHGKVDQLSESELDDLVAYLESL
jgi:cytochrome c peroxidase